MALTWNGAEPLVLSFGRFLVGGCAYRVQLENICNLNCALKAGFGLDFCIFTCAGDKVNRKFRLLVSIVHV